MTRSGRANADHGGCATGDVMEDIAFNNRARHATLLEAVEGHNIRVSTMFVRVFKWLGVLRGPDQLFSCACRTRAPPFPLAATTRSFAHGIHVRGLA